MKIRCTDCQIELRYREMSLCNAINQDYTEHVQLCSDCIQNYI
jgi:hypothetical protein